MQTSPSPQGEGYLVNPFPPDRSKTGRGKVQAFMTCSSRREKTKDAVDGVPMEGGIYGTKHEA